MRTIIIGDIHGCCEALDTLLALMNPDAEKDQLVLLGDLFDRGPDSYGVFQRVKQVADLFGERFVLLLGNHEDYLLKANLTRRQRKIWEQVGRQETVDSFVRAGACMEDAIPWLIEHSRLYWKSSAFQCVHAGIMVDPPEVNDLDTLVHNHEIVLMNRYAGPLTIVGHIALKEATWFAGDGETTKHYKDNVTMHLPTNGVVCIDTGCGKGGKLTAMDIEGRTFSLRSVSESGMITK